MGGPCSCISISSTWTCRLWKVLNIAKMASRGEYDCIVIGAGVQGSFTAYHLSKRNKKTLLLEQVCQTRNFAPLSFYQALHWLRHFSTLETLRLRVFWFGSSCAIAIKTSGVADPVSLSEVPLPCWNLRSKQASRDMSGVTCHTVICDCSSSDSSWRYLAFNLLLLCAAKQGILLTKGPSSCYHDVLTHALQGSAFMSSLWICIWLEFLSWKDNKVVTFLND